MDLPDGIRRVRLERAHLAVRLESMHFPIDLEDLSNVLRGRNYKLLGLPQSRVPQLPSGIRLSVTGQLAESEDGECVVSMSPDRGIISLNGREVSRVVDEFRSIETAIKDDLVLDWDDRVRFYEIILDALVTVSADRDPVAEIGRLQKDSHVLGQVSTILNFPATLFGLRIVRKDQYPGDNTWIEFKIEPSVSKPRTDYLVNVVHRDKDRATVLDRADELLDKAITVVNHLRGGA